MISCEFRSHGDETPATCALVADLSGQPVRLCIVSPETCYACLTSTHPSKVNEATAQAAMDTVQREAPDRLPDLQSRLTRHVPDDVVVVTGYEMAFPEHFPCVHRGATKGMIGSDLENFGTFEFPLYDCAKHQVCTVGRRNTKIKAVCMGCPDREAPPTDERRVIVLNSDLHGFGDACFMAWTSEGSRDAPVKLLHYATGKMRAFLEMLGQEVTDDPTGAVNTFDAYFSMELELERGSVPRVLSRSRALGIQSVPKRPPATIPEEATAWAAQIVEQHRRQSPTGKFVACFPQTVYVSREWPASYWLDLVWELRRLGYASMLCLGEEEKRWENSPGYIYGMPWTHWAAIMQAADLTVAVSSGPACLAGTLDVPTLVLEGSTKPTIWAHCPSVEAIRVTKEQMHCVGCHFGPPFRAACDQGCFALMRLYPDVVLKRIEEKINEPRDRAFSDWAAVLAGFEGLAGGV